MNRPFLLLQARDHDDPMGPHEVACFKGAMGLADDELVVMNAVDGIPARSDVDGCCAVLMGGSGNYSSLDDDPWIHDLIAFSRNVLVLEGKPVFASCFGFQILVRAVGGSMIRDHRRTEMGTFDLQTTELGLGDPLFRHLGVEFPAQVGHMDRAHSVPPGVHTCALSALCPVHAIRIGHLPIWATQFHPELDRADMETRYLHYKDKYFPPGAGTHDRSQDDPFVQSLRTSEAACALLAHFRRWVQDHERSLARAA